MQRHKIQHEINRLLPTPDAVVQKVREVKRFLCEIFENSYASPATSETLVIWKLILLNQFLNLKCTILHVFSTVEQKWFSEIVCPKPFRDCPIFQYFSLVFSGNILLFRALLETGKTGYNATTEKNVKMKHGSHQPKRHPDAQEELKH